MVLIRSEGDVDLTGVAELSRTELDFQPRGGDDVRTNVPQVVVVIRLHRHETKAGVVTQASRARLALINAVVGEIVRATSEAVRPSLPEMFAR